MRVLVACEFSGTVRDAFIRMGHEAISCDLLPTERPGPHIQGDVRPLLKSGNFDMVIAHPPCTRLCNSGVRWLHERDLWFEMYDGAEFFLECLEAEAEYVIVENPVMHSHAIEIIGRKHDFSIQPWQFGDPFKKRTCFWVKGEVPPLRPTSLMESWEADAACHKEAPGENRWKVRSETYPRVARAMAWQWGCLGYDPIFDED